MDFLIGLSTILVLAPFFMLVVYLMKMLPGEFSLAAIALMVLEHEKPNGGWSGEHKTLIVEQGNWAKNYFLISYRNNRTY